MPLLKLGSIDAAITVTVKCPQPVFGTEIERIAISNTVPVRRVDPIPVTQTVLIRCVNPVTGTILHHITCHRSC